MTLAEACAKIRPPDKEVMSLAKKRLDSIVKPLGSLGLLEEHLVKIAGMTGSAEFDFTRKAVAVFCADNGVVAQEVTQSPGEVTAVVAENIARGDACVCKMAGVAGAEVIPVDIGIAREMAVPGLLNGKVMFGTCDFTVCPAMLREQAEAAVGVGITTAGELARQGFSMLATGEMGIGNTTTAAAMAAVLLGRRAEEVTGRGAGLSKEGYARKLAVVKRGIELHRPVPEDPVEVLRTVGGLDIAGMAGLCIGGAACGVPVVLDGVISCVAALTACRICPAARDYLLPSHLPAEPAGALLLAELGMTPPLRAGLRLGEGTGAVATFPLYDMIAAVYRGTVTFAEAEMDPYLPLR